MIEVLTFTFQDFWHWLGTVIMIATVVSPLITYAAAKGDKC